MQEELYRKAVGLAEKDGYVRLSRLQRALRIGYATASHLIDRMIESGVIENEGRYIRVPNEKIDGVFDTVYGYAYIKGTV